MDWWAVYYAVCAALWAFLAAMAVRAWWGDFPAWLAEHRRVMIFLLGTDRQPENARRTLRRFYTFLSVGWTWLLVWSWWLMPWLKKSFYASAHGLQAYKLARFAVLVLLVAYAGFGFFCIGKAIQIWAREIYGPGSRPEAPGKRP